MPVVASTLDIREIFQRVSAIAQEVLPHDGPGNPVGAAGTACSDGLVPYASAHLEGAASELRVTAGRSVQETPEAILELRRILHLHLETTDNSSY